MAKTLRLRRIKPYFQLPRKIIELCTYGYFIAHNGHLTSFVVGTRRRSFVENLSVWTKYLHTKSLLIDFYASIDLIDAEKIKGKIQGRKEEQIRTKTTKKAEAKYSVFVKIKNQNGAVFLSILQTQRKSL